MCSTAEKTKQIAVETRATHAIRTSTQLNFNEIEITYVSAVNWKTVKKNYGVSKRENKRTEIAVNNT